MSAARNHCRGRSSSGGGDNSRTHRTLDCTFEMTIEPDLNTKPYCQSNHIIPKLTELILGKTPTRNKRNNSDVHQKQYGCGPNPIFPRNTHRLFYKYSYLFPNACFKSTA